MLTLITGEGTSTPSYVIRIVIEYIFAWPKYHIAPKFHGPKILWSKNFVNLAKLALK